MPVLRRMFGLPIVVGAIMAFSALAATAPAPAQADNCQIEQLANQAPLMPESEDPRCIILAYVGCPNLLDPVGCAGGVAGTPARLVDCIQQFSPLINPNPCNFPY